MLRLEKEQEDLEYKLSVEENKKVPLLKEDNVRKFLEFYARHDFDNADDRNDFFFKNFIKRILVFDDKVTVILNTSNDYQTEIEIEQEKDIKTRLNHVGSTESRVVGTVRIMGEPTCVWVQTLVCRA